MLKPPRGSRNQTVLRISLVCLFCLVVLVSLVSWLSVVCSVSLKRAAKEEQEAPEKTRMRSTNGRRLENYKKLFSCPNENTYFHRIVRTCFRA